MYCNGKIYKVLPIVEYEDGDIYFGSTATLLSIRFERHKEDYQKWKKGISTKKTQTFELFDKYGIDNCEIILIEKVGVTTKQELLDRESFYIRNNKCIIKWCQIEL